MEDHVFSATSTYTNPLKAVEFFKKTGVDALAISYGTMHGASKGKNVKLRKEIVIAIKECLMHEGIFGVLVSHGSSTVPKYIVDEINALGGNIQNAHGISVDELKAAIPCGISLTLVHSCLRSWIPLCTAMFLMKMLLLWLLSSKKVLKKLLVH